MAQLIKTGQVTGRSKEDNLIILQIAVNRIEDIRNSDLYQDAGSNSNPHNGNVALILDVTDDFKIAIGIDDGCENDLQPGEIEIYSYDSNGAKLARILLNKNEETVINNGSDYAVQFTALQTAFNELKNKYNDLVIQFNNFISTYNLHTHPTAPTGPISIPSVLATENGSASSADIDPSKIEKIRV